MKDPKLWIELFGYLGSGLVVVSMLMTSVIRLRVINLIGSVIFAIYALIIQSYPTAVMNFFLVGINVYHLVRLLKTEKHYELIRTEQNDPYFGYLLRDSMEDIRLWFPDFSPDGLDADVAYLVCCDRNPAGLFLGKRSGSEIEVLLDYATPVYRDTSVGRFLYNALTKDGCRRFTFRDNAPKHIGYLEKMGYRKTDEGVYVLTK